MSDRHRTLISQHAQDQLATIWRNGREAAPAMSAALERISAMLQRNPQLGATVVDDPQPGRKVRRLVALPLAALYSVVQESGEVLIHDFHLVP